MGFGSAISGIGQDVSEFGSVQEKLRQQMEQMAELRREKLLEDSRNAAADKRAQDEADRKTKDAADADAADAEIAAGHPGVTTPAKTIPGSTMLGPPSALQPEGSKTPDVTTPESTTPRTPLTRTEILQTYLAHGRISPDKYLEYTKEDPTATVLPIALKDIEATMNGLPDPSTKAGLRARTAAANTLASKYAVVAGTPAFKEALDRNQKNQTDQVFNPNYLEGRMGSKFIDESKKDAERYNQTKGFLEQAEGTYKDYKKNPNDPGVRANMIATLDKFTGVSLQKAPTEAQLKLAQAFPGFENWDKVVGNLMQGTPVAPKVLDKMMVVMREEGKGLARQLITQNNTRAGQFQQYNLPVTLNTPNETVAADTARWTNANNEQESPKVWRTDKNGKSWEYDALTKKPTGNSK